MVTNEKIATYSLFTYKQSYKHFNCHFHVAMSCLAGL